MEGLEECGAAGGLASVLLGAEGFLACSSPVGFPFAGPRDLSSRAVSVAIDAAFCPYHAQRCPACLWSASGVNSLRPGLLLLGFSVGPPRSSVGAGGSEKCPWLELQPGCLPKLPARMRQHGMIFHSQDSLNMYAIQKFATS